MGFSVTVTPLGATWQWHVNQHKPYRHVDEQAERQRHPRHHYQQRCSDPTGGSAAAVAAAMATASASSPLGCICA
jgi:hypothetical protein